MRTTAMVLASCVAFSACDAGSPVAPSVADRRDPYMPPSAPSAPSVRESWSSDSRTRYARQMMFDVKNIGLLQRHRVMSAVIFLRGSGARLSMQQGVELKRGIVDAVSAVLGHAPRVDIVDDFYDGRGHFGNTRMVVDAKRGVHTWTHGSCSPGAGGCAWGTSPYVQIVDPDRWKRLVYELALHETGHVLGFRHVDGREFYDSPMQSGVHEGVRFGERERCAWRIVHRNRGNVERAADALANCSGGRPR